MALGSSRGSVSGAETWMTVVLPGVMICVVAFIVSLVIIVLDTRDRLFELGLLLLALVSIVFSAGPLAFVLLYFVYALIR
jgi:hypothetical protein